MLTLLLNVCNTNWGFPGGSDVKNLPAMQETWVQSLDREDPWRREWLLLRVNELINQVNLIKLYI